MPCTTIRPGAVVRRAGVAAITACCVLGLPAVGESQPHDREPNRGGAIDLSSQDPDIALSRLRVADGYEVSLYASEREFPELANPLAMTFDTRGRLWVLTSPTYPHYLPGQPPDDKLIILDDTNQDGRADEVTVFAEGLYIPTGFELGDGGAYVAQQPNLVFLRDTDGDDRADERRTILHGFGTEDSHHAIHAFTWGPGGGLHFQEGTFLHSQVETPYGPVRLKDAGVFRYEPRTEKLSVFVSYPFANPWGHVVDRWGQHFISDASNGYNYYGTAFSGHVDYPDKQQPLKEWTLTRVRPTCGIEFVRSRHFPESAQGNFLFNNVIGFQGIKQYRVEEEGSGFVAVEVDPLLQSSDVNFRPIALQFGPDGALYVGDWFNPLVGHMQYSMRDPRRDKTHGRVWRITAKGRPLLPRPGIHGRSIEAQLELLKSYEDRTRYQARLALRSQPTEAVTRALGAWVAGLDRADGDYEHHLLEALWVYQHHDVVQSDLLQQLLQAREFRARAAAVRVLHHWLDRVDAGMALLGRMVRDPEPRVRLEAVRALSFVPTEEAAELALQALRLPTDYYLQYVLDATMRTLTKEWKPVLTSGRPFGAGNPEGLAYVLARLAPSELVQLPRSVAVYEALLSAPGLDLKHRREALDGLARARGTSPLSELLSAIRRIDGTPGSSQATQDLAQVLAAADADRLAAVRADLQRLALDGRNDAVRQGALAAIVRADAGVAGAWELTEASPRHRIDLLSATSLLGDDAWTSALYPRAAHLLADGASATGTHTAPPVRGRYVRVVMPGRRVLSLSEVQVFSGAENVAQAGAATQSSTVAGGAIGGHASNAIDGREPNGAGGGTSAFTSVEDDPWWEVDLGGERDIHRIVVWPAAGGGEAERLHLTLLDASRVPVFTRDGLRSTGEVETVSLGGDLTVPLLNAALRALPDMRGREAEAVALLTRFVARPETGEAAIAALRRIAPAQWPTSQLAPLAGAVVAYVRAIPSEQRTGPAFLQAVQVGRELAARLPAEEGRSTAGSLDALVVRTIRIEAMPAQMKFDVSRFTVTAGAEIELVLVNRDEMPHNLLVTIPGALESVSLKAEAMMQQPDAYAKHFVPDTREVLQATPLINGGETSRLRFTVPTEPGGYPFVCTFPGHWRTMNGVMEVVSGQ